MEKPNERFIQLEVLENEETQQAC